MSQLRRDWQSALFANADLPQFADAYAQTLTYALLLARLDGLEEVGTGEAAQEKLRGRGHALLAEVLRNMADPQARQEFDTPLNLLERAIGAVDVGQLRRGDSDPWLYFYEHFLAAYDPALRNNRGVYYTPVEVVRAQVRLIGDLLERRFGKPLTYADEDVVTLDPAAGTGTYPLAVIEHALEAVDERLGPGAVPSYASTLARNVARLRAASRAVRGGAPAGYRADSGTGRRVAGRRRTRVPERHAGIPICRIAAPNGSAVEESDPGARTGAADQEPGHGCWSAWAIRRTTGRKSTCPTKLRSARAAGYALAMRARRRTRATRATQPDRCWTISWTRPARRARACI